CSTAKDVRRAAARSLAEAVADGKASPDRAQSRLVSLGEAQVPGGGHASDLGSDADPPAEEGPAQLGRERGAGVQVDLAFRPGQTQPANHDGLHRHAETEAERSPSDGEILGDPGREP